MILFSVSNTLSIKLKMLMFCFSVLFSSKRFLFLLYAITLSKCSAARPLSIRSITGFASHPLFLPVSRNFRSVFYSSDKLVKTLSVGLSSEIIVRLLSKCAMSLRIAFLCDIIILRVSDKIKEFGVQKMTLVHGTLTVMVIMLQHVRVLPVPLSPPMIAISEGYIIEIDLRIRV